MAGWRTFPYIVQEALPEAAAAAAAVRMQTRK